MAILTWRFLINQLVSVSKGRRKRMNSIIADTYPNMQSGSLTNPLLVPMLPVLAAEINDVEEQGAPTTPVV